MTKWHGELHWYDRINWWKVIAILIIGLFVWTVGDSFNKQYNIDIDHAYRQGQIDVLSGQHVMYKMVIHGDKTVTWEKVEEKK